MREPSPLVDLPAAARHRAVAARFGDVARSVTDWDAPTPVTEWAARDVVRHLVEWFPAFLAAGGIELPPAPSVDDDPAAAWEVRSASVQELVDDPARADEEFTHPMAGTHRLGDAVDRFYTADVFMHTWDLARSAGVAPDLDPAWSAQMLEGMEHIDELLRSSGQYGPRMPVADDADAGTKLMAFVGRDPEWRPEG